MQVEEQDALQARIAVLEKKLKAAESQCQATTKEIWQMEVDLARMEERVREAEEQLESARQQPSASATDSAELSTLRQELERTREEREALEAYGQQLQEQLEEVQRILDERDREFNDLQHELQQARSVPEQQLAELQHHLDVRTAEAFELKQLLESSTAEALELKQLLDARTAEAFELRQHIESGGAELAELRNQLEARSEQSLSLQQQLEELTAELSAAQDRLDTPEPGPEVEELRQQVAELLGQLEALRATEEGLRQAQTQLEGEYLQLEQRSSEAEFERSQLVQECETLRQRLQGLAEQSGVAASAEVLRLQENLALQQEKSQLLQARSEQLQQRLELAEEKANLYQIRLQEAEQRLNDVQSQSGQSGDEARQLRDQLTKMESRVRDADRIYEAAEQQAREAEQKNQESWARVRDAEMRANQALVENKKLADKLAEHERRAQESDRETQRLAFQDPLTGLPNLNLMTQYMDFTVKQCVRYRRVAALLVIDIDRFKVFNEAMGSKAGDELLAKVAERLQQSIRETDSLGRKGEDEFIILLSELNVGDHNNPEGRIRAIHQHVEVVANRVMQMMAAPFIVQGQKFYLHVSIGIAICPDDGETPQILLENGDTAMYHVKETGRNRHQFYTTDLRRRQERRLSLDTQMRSALERNEFEVRYFPVVSLAKGKGLLVGVESLLRWNHRMEGVVGPNFFLPAAEESGMIVPIGQWVLQQTCTQMREWLSNGLRIFASINLSKRQLIQADLVESISRELSQNGIPPEVLYVEIAEGFNTFNPEVMDEVITKLGTAGIRIAIDDFGIGYSNLSRLNLNYTRVLKIDRSIVEKCPNDRQSSTVCIAAINLASSLGLLSLAEGVENINQVRFLTKYGCALAQGYYFSEPVPASEITNFHRTKKVWKL